MPPAAAGEADNTITTMTETTTAAKVSVDLSLLDTCWKTHDDDDETPSSTTTRGRGGSAATVDRLMVTSPKTDFQKLISREGIKSRLRTFLPLTYFNKPRSLSPIVCARFGWINTSLDMIKCCCCGSAIMVKIHPKITKQSTKQKIIKAYQNKLAKSHKSTCPFQFEAEMHLIQQPSRQQQHNIHNHDALIVPSHFSSILPQDVWEMLEKPKPLPYLRNRLQALLEILLVGNHNNDDNDATIATIPSDGEPPKWRLPKMELPEEVLKFGVIQKHNTTTTTTTNTTKLKKQRRMLSKLAFDPHKPYTTTLGLEEETLLTKLETILIPHKEGHDIRAHTRIMEAWEDLHEGLVGLALLGWEPAPAPVVATLATATAEGGGNKGNKNSNDSNKEALLETIPEEQNDNRAAATGPVVVAGRRKKVNNNDDDDDDDKPIITLHCTVCLSNLEFPLLKYDNNKHQNDDDAPVDNDNDNNMTTTTPPPSKRRRTSSFSSLLNPLMAHRCHCPYVCGFPKDGQRKTTPIWEIVANKLLKNHYPTPTATTTTTTTTPATNSNKNNEAHHDDNNTNSMETDDNSSVKKDAEKDDGEAAMDRILNVLESGVSSMQVKQSAAIM